MAKVYNMHHRNAPEEAVYVGRGSPWGNPYKIDTTRSRAVAIELFKMHVEKHPDFKEYIKKELKGKDLVCYCTPAPCHADYLLEIANQD